MPYLVRVNLVQLLLDPVRGHIWNDIGPGIRCPRYCRLPRLEILGDPVDDNTKAKRSADDLGSGNRQIDEVWRQ